LKEVGPGIDKGLCPYDGQGAPMPFLYDLPARSEISAGKVFNASEMPGEVEDASIPLPLSIWQCRFDGPLDGLQQRGRRGQSGRRGHKP
jgi:hypothetical protein